MRQRRRWVWGGRVIALLALIGLAIYLWQVGLDRADRLASSIGLVVAVAALLAPYVVPPGTAPVADMPTLPIAPGASPLGATAATAGQSQPTPPTASIIGHAFPSSTSSASGTLSSAAPKPTALVPKTVLVEAVMGFADIEDPEFRRMVLKSMGDRLGLAHPFSAPYRATALDHVISIVGRIWEFKDPVAARLALIAALSELRPDDAASARMQSLL